MDFFEAQALARKRTARLFVLFAFAVLGLVAASYFAFIYLSAALGLHALADGPGIATAPGDLTAVDLWQPGALLALGVLTFSVVGGACLYKWMRLRSGGHVVAESIGARLVPADSAAPHERRLLNVVEEMAIASGVPLPAVYVLEDEQSINAFAAGLTASDAVVAVTRGTLEKLTRDELQGVIAHEFSHILNGDMRLNTRLTAVLFGILFVGLIGRGILRGLGFRRPRRSGGKQGAGGVAVILVLGVVLLILGYAGYFFGRLIQAAVSRQREFLADASAVQFTRSPGGIAGALKKIGGYALGSSLRSDRAAEISHFLFAQGFRSLFGGLWATHPPLDVRIRALDASFDGKYFVAPTVVDVETQSWNQRPGARSTAPGLEPRALVASVGVLTAIHVDRARELQAVVPPALLEAVQSPTGAFAVACGLLREASGPEHHARQTDLIRTHAGPGVVAALEPLASALASTPPESRLTLLLLAPPALRRLPAADLARLLETLDELVHADAHVSLFEFALQKVLAHHLRLSARPTDARERYAPSDLAHEISIVLSFAARLGHADGLDAQSAFSAGAVEFSGLYPPLRFVPGLADLGTLDLALDKLGLAYAPVKKRLLLALAITVSRDGRLDVSEGELVRAIASTLDCPVPLAV